MLCNRSIPSPVFIGAAIALLCLLASHSLRSSPSSHPEVRSGEDGSATVSCASCHKEESREEGSHPAISQLGCESCHVVSEIDGEQTIQLAAEGNELCFICHDDKKPDERAGIRTHSPLLEGDCLGCHDPHNSAYTPLLRAPVEDTSEENLCFTCHADIAESARGKSVHAAMEMGCSVCHETHKSGPATEPEFAFHLTSAAPALCLVCHDGDDAGLVSAHSGQPFKDSDCTGCHNPHGSQLAKLIRPKRHQPFADNQCDACHDSPRDGQITLVENGSKELCFVCHDDKKQQLEASQVKHTLFDIDDTCTTCHNPHTSDQPRLLRQPVRQLCGNCHEQESTVLTAEVTIHQAVEMDGSCSLCHDAHASDYPNHLRAAGNQLCLECHKSRGQELSDTMKLFQTVPISRDEFRKSKKLRLNEAGDRGHPLANHWVATIPDLTRPGEKMGCLTCHLPHNSAADKLVRVLTVKDPEGNDQRIDVCRGCHNELDRQVAAQRVRMVPAVEEQIRRRQAETQQLREEYLQRIPKLGPPE